MFQKKKRLKDRELLDRVKQETCVACDGFPTDPAHVTSRGAGGGDTQNNVMALCRLHHIEQGQTGWGAFMIEYPPVRSWLLLKNRGDVIERSKRVAH